jgi:uncharacterized protein YegJ (DUF2314 family)
MKSVMSKARALVTSVGAWLSGRIRKRDKSRMISLVVLLREPMTVDSIVLAKMAGRAWHADLGDGLGYGEDGGVVSVGPISTVLHQERGYLVNCFPAPYCDDPQSVAESIPDLRIRRCFREHRAWFSCDALAGDTLSEDEVRESYACLGRLLAEFFDESWLLIYVPDTSRAFAINDETEQALQSADPIAALEKTCCTPVIHVDADDPMMEQAIAQARESWPQFIAAFEAGAGESFSVKAPLSYAEVTEFIWIEISALEGGRVYGLLGNEPADLGPLKLGSKVSVPVSDVIDWYYLDRDDEFQGGFTTEAVLKAASGD